MKDLSRVNQVFQLIDGILFAVFGVLCLMTPVFVFGDIIWIAGAVTLAALIRLILICLPGSGTFYTGGTAPEIAAGILEALFGIIFILDALIYVEFLFPLIAVLLLVLAVIRTRQSMLVKKQGLNGWGSYVFIAILFFAAAAGLLLFEFAIKLNLQFEIAGAASFMYGFFLVFSSFLKSSETGSAAFEFAAQPVSEVAGEEVTAYSQELRTRRKLTE